MKSILLLACVVLFAGCATSNVHEIVCTDLSRCYSSAASKCRGHWTQVTKYGEASPYAYYKDNIYTMNIRCTHSSE